ncbi:hypothetical protein AHAS_Ahas02G0163900 [Arachis hypogaea]
MSDAPPPRTVLVQQCIRDRGVLEVLCNYDAISLLKLRFGLNLVLHVSDNPVFDSSIQIFSEKRGQWKAATQSRENIRSFQRYYSNTYLDGNKQKAINLFLGHFQPQQGKPALWEIDSDQYCTVGKHGPSSVNSNVRYDD